MSKPEKPEECQSCGYVTTALKLFEKLDTTIAGGGKIRQDDFWFCDLCSWTPASTYSRRPDTEPSNSDVVRTICYVGNALLAALKKGSRRGNG